MLGWFKKKNIPVLSAREGYDLWASTYATEINPIKDFSNKIIDQLLPDLAGKSVLDAGCGSGHFCMMAEKNHASRIVGIDLSQSMIDEAKRNCPTGEFHCGDLSTTHLDLKSFDVIICALVIGHIENISDVLKNISGMLKKNGSLIITDFHPTQTINNAKRTFKNPQSGETMEILHFLHPIEKVKEILNSFGLEIKKTEEPEWDNTPVVYGLLSMKADHGSVA